MRTRMLAALAVSASLLLAGCTADDGIAGGGTGGYISGDGSIVQIPADGRADAAEWSGETDDGETVSSADLAGRVTLLNFWYASCAPCIDEAPDLQELSSRYAADDAVAFVGVNIQDSAAVTAAFEEEYGITYPSILDVTTRDVTSAFAANVPPTAVPTTLILDAEGRVAVQISGRIPSVGTVADLIDETVAEAG